MMKQTTKRLLVSLAALILSVGAVCTSYAASDKRKVGKMDLVFDSNLGIGVGQLPFRHCGGGEYGPLLYQ